MEDDEVNRGSRTRIAGLVLAALGTLAPWAAGFAEDGKRLINPFAGQADAIPQGASLLNQYCAHCHGFNADQSERARDLKRLKIRYGDDMASVFYHTATNGRMDKGMPIWKGVLTDETLWKIFTFLQSVQEED